MSARYERVTFKPEGARRSRTVFLEVKSETPELLSGIEVDREGDEVVPKGYDERLRIISTALISERAPMVMDLIYGELVEAQS